MADAQKKKSWWKICLLLIVVLAVVGGAIGWYKFFREEPQPDWVTATPDMRFKYGSIGAEHDAGIPYWIFFVLPRMFPEKLPGPGGYASLGVAWEQGQELPIGFTKKVIGFPRVANNCASCHVASYRKSASDNPVFVPTGPNHTLNLQAFFRFVVDCAKDPRFNADEIMSEIALVYKMPLLDKLIYRYLLIPIAKKRLLEREKQFQWVYHKEFPLWGRGRDDAMNLTKYFLLNWPMDDSIGPTDMPSVWNLKKYKPEKGMLMNLAGDSHDARSVIIDSALGLLSAAPRACRRRKSARTASGLKPGASRPRSSRTKWCAASVSSGAVWWKSNRAATSRHFSTAFGCVRPIYTTVRCPRCAICSNPSPIVRKSFIAAMTFMIRSMSVL